MRHYPAIVTSMLVMLPLSEARAQASRSDPTDLQAWAGFEITLDLPNRWEAEVEYQLRLQGDGSSYRGSYVTLQAGREVFDDFTLLANYRRAMVDGGTFNRVGFGAQYSTRLGDARISFRQLFQYQHQSFSDGDTDGDLLARSRLRVRYPLSGAVDVYGSIEPYLRFGEEEPLDNWRNTLGLRYEFADGRRVKMFYLYRPDFAKSYVRTYHVVGVEFDFELEF